MIVFPDPLYESFYNASGKFCFLCGKKSHSCLYRKTTPLIPLCKCCSSDWNFHGYEILKRIKIQKLLLFKLKYMLRKPSFLSLIKNIHELRNWIKDVKTYKKSKA